jgi:hypothetical protein
VSSEAACSEEKTGNDSVQHLLTCAPKSVELTFVSSVEHKPGEPGQNFFPQRQGCKICLGIVFTKQLPVQCCGYVLETRSIFCKESGRPAAYVWARAELSSSEKKKKTVGARSPEKQGDWEERIFRTCSSPRSAANAGRRRVSLDAALFKRNIDVAGCESRDLPYMEVNQPQLHSSFFVM